MDKDILSIENLRALWIFVTTIWCLILAIMWNKDNIMNLCAKLTFWFIGIAGIIIILKDLNF